MPVVVYSNRSSISYYTSESTDFQTYILVTRSSFRWKLEHILCGTQQDSPGSIYSSHILSLWLIFQFLWCHWRPMTPRLVCGAWGGTWSAWVGIDRYYLMWCAQLRRTRCQWEFLCTPYYAYGHAGLGVSLCQWSALDRMWLFQHAD